MKTLLINGCSFGHIWKPSIEFITHFDCDAVTNISKPGTGFQRTCRSTIEWIAQHGAPQCVVIPITYSHRWEMPIGQNKLLDDIDGNWIPIQLVKAMEENTWKDIDIKNNREKIYQLSDLYYGLIESTIGYWDKLFTEMLMLCAFLDQHNIPYLMWDMCNDFDEGLLIGPPHVRKAGLIKKNKNILNIFSFCGNKYMWRAKNMPANEHFNQHHNPEQYLSLEQYLIEYSKDKTILD